jgi:predicted RNase H-like HicB family nuclease
MHLPCPLRYAMRSDAATVLIHVERLSDDAIDCWMVSGYTDGDDERFYGILFARIRKRYESGKGILSTVTKTLTAVLHREEELYVAECPEVGTVSQGYTVEEAIANLKEATELYLEEFPLPLVSKPLMTTFEAVVSEAACA